MTLQAASEMLCSDLHALEARLLASGWPVRARLTACGVSGRPGSRGMGLFLRFNADGEEYVFTMTGNPVGIEQLVLRQHDLMRIALASEWPQYASTPFAGHGGGDFTRYGHGDSDHGEEASAGYDEQEQSPVARRASERRLRHHHTFSIQRRPDGLWTACVSIPVKGGPLYLCATADEHAVAQALHGELADVSGDRSWVGNDRFRMTAGEVAKERATDRVSGALRQLAGNPSAHAVFGSIIPFVTTRDNGGEWAGSGFDFGDVAKVFQQVVADKEVQKVFTTLVPSIPIVGQPAAAAFQVARSAMGIVDKVNEGDPKATAGVKKLVDMAKVGNVKAVHALKAIKLAQKMKQGKIPMYKAPDERDERLARLEAENKELQMKLLACEKKWDKSPLDAADDVIDMWGGQDEFFGPDVVQGAGQVIAGALEAVGGRALARPLVARYYRDRLPVGRVDRTCTPEVGALYNRPMRESSVASLRRDYLRGSALQQAGFPQGRRFLSWPRSA